MTDTTHTPGLWLVADTTVYSLQSDGHVLVNRFSAHVQTGVGRDAQRTPLAELEANARLMAEAPNLLAALQEVLPLAENWGHPDHPGIAAARAAIARATGGAV